MYSDPPPAQVLFDAPVYHWTTPYGESPNFITNASFFYQGKYLGKGMEGYQGMLKSVAQQKPQTILMLGSLYGYKRMIPAKNIPFDEHDLTFMRTVREANVKVIICDCDLDFQRWH
jgi:hypothetical protein